MINLGLVIFLHPMWHSETQRLGMKACTPLGYYLRGIGDLIGFIGLLLLPAVTIFLVVQGFRHKFLLVELWLLLIPIFVGVIGRVFYEAGWHMAQKRKYNYDYESDSVTWTDGGIEKRYKRKTRRS